MKRSRGPVTALLLSLVAGLPAAQSAKLVDARTAVVVDEDGQADSKRVATCVRGSLQRVTQLALADVREQADVIITVSAHLPSAATKAVLGIFGGSPSASLTVDAHDGERLWQQGAKYRRSMLALTFPGEDAIACGLADDLAVALREARRPPPPPPPPVHVEPPILVFVGAAERDGFIDTSKGIQDSIGDLDGQLRQVKGIAFVPREQAADVTVFVASRGIGSEPWGERVTSQRLYAGAVLAETPIVLNTWWVNAILVVTKTGYRKEFVGAYAHPPGLAYFGGGWTECAKRLGNDIGSWINANRDRLKALQ